MVSDALLIIGLLVVATIAFRRRGATLPVRWSNRKPGGAGGGRGGGRVTWAERMAAFRLASQLLTALILLYLVVEIARRLFG